jgi:hypothetical protein
MLLIINGMGGVLVNDKGERYLIHVVPPFWRVTTPLFILPFLLIIRLVWQKLVPNIGMELLNLQQYKVNNC